MCGIYGSSDKERFDVLYRLNKQERGNFAFGGMGIYWNSPALISKQADKKDSDDNKSDLFPTLKKGYSKESPIYYLGHSQAPTTDVRDFKPETSHPFVCGNWVVAHNGIISNFSELRYKYDFGDKVCDVDSSIIPALLDRENSLDEIICIENTCRLLEGIYACWLYNKKSDNIYLIRCGSTLFINEKNGSFSSTLYENLTSAKEGVIYQLNNFSNITSVGSFKLNSPYIL